MPIHLKQLPVEIQNNENARQFLEFVDGLAKPDGIVDIFDLRAMGSDFEALNHVLKTIYHISSSWIESSQIWYDPKRVHSILVSGYTGYDIYEWLPKAREGQEIVIEVTQIAYEGYTSNTEDVYRIKLNPQFIESLLNEFQNTQEPLENELSFVIPFDANYYIQKKLPIATYPGNSINPVAELTPVQNHPDLAIVSMQIESKVCRDAYRVSLALQTSVDFFALAGATKAKMGTASRMQSMDDRRVPGFSHPIPVEKNGRVSYVPLVRASTALSRTGSSAPISVGGTSTPTPSLPLIPVMPSNLGVLPNAEWPANTEFPVRVEQRGNGTYGPNFDVWGSDNGANSAQFGSMSLGDLSLNSLAVKEVQYVAENGQTPLATMRYKHTNALLGYLDSKGKLLPELLVSDAVSHVVEDGYQIFSTKEDRRVELKIYDQAGQLQFLILFINNKPVLCYIEKNRDYEILDKMIAQYLRGFLEYTAYKPDTDVNDVSAQIFDIVLDNIPQYFLFPIPAKSAIGAQIIGVPPTFLLSKDKNSATLFQVVDDNHSVVLDVNLHSGCIEYSNAASFIAEKNSFTFWLLKNGKVVRFDEIKPQIKIYESIESAGLASSENLISELAYSGERSFSGQTRDGEEIDFQAKGNVQAISNVVMVPYNKGRLVFRVTELDAPNSQQGWKFKIEWRDDNGQWHLCDSQNNEDESFIDFKLPETSGIQKLLRLKLKLNYTAESNSETVTKKLLTLSLQMLGQETQEFTWVNVEVDADLNYFDNQTAEDLLEKIRSDLHGEDFYIQRNGNDRFIIRAFSDSQDIPLGAVFYDENCWQQRVRIGDKILDWNGLLNNYIMAIY